MACTFGQKNKSYSTVTHEGKTRFKCLICGVYLSSKQRILLHLVNIHSMSPMKREKKKYLDCPSIPIPRRTVMRKRSLKYTANKARTDNQDCLKESNSDVQCFKHSCTRENSEQVSLVDSNDLMLIKNHGIEHNKVYTNTFHTDATCSDNGLDTNLETITENLSVDYDSDVSDCLSVSSVSDSSDDLNSSYDDENKDSSNFIPKKSSTEIHALALLSYVSKHNLSASSVDDLLLVLGKMFPDTIFLPTTYKKLINMMPSPDYTQIHYCSECSAIFPVDSSDEYRCTTNNCTGLRYIGSESSQLTSTRKVNCFFTIANIKAQLKNLLSKNHVWKAVKETKQKLLKNSGSTIQDITDGKFYKKVSCKNQFLDPQGTNISLSFNTDGIPLFSSSKSKLWPFFLVINELPPGMRFSRENIILAGIWQGKTKPPFYQYLHAIGNSLNELNSSGIQLRISDNKENITVKIMVLLGCVDLQAKAYIANMSMHNGEYGCVTCEEPGIVTKQGRGHTRAYPYTSLQESAPLRNSKDIKENKAPFATNKKRLKGICGPSGLENFPGFDCVLGLVPDYMHGVLLGTTKSLLYKWFSSTNCQEPYFIGKSIKLVSERLQRIRPPDYLERLPRDLEKHYSNLKATELQTWLLHYAIPCLHGILPQKYLEHLSCLSEGVHILLSASLDEDDLQRADYLLDLFYKDFAKLYGNGSTGLNVHNIGKHLVYYVRLWGPLFGWNCFGFEDFNARILDYAHGTGDVTCQIIRRHNASLYLSRINTSTVEDEELASCIKQMSLGSSKKIKTSREAANCEISGACNNFTTSIGHENELYIQACCNVEDKSSLLKILRITVNGEKFYGTEYTKMKKRQCSIALTNTGNVLKIRFFCLNTNSNIVYAIGYNYEVDHTGIFPKSGHHILRAFLSEDLVVIPVDCLVEKVFLVEVEQCCYISRVPNRMGYGVLK